MKIAPRPQGLAWAITLFVFDGVTTLAEEVENPKRTVPRATALVCLFTGLLGMFEIYLA